MTLEAKVDLLLEKIESLESRLIKQQTDMCEPKEACAIIGVNNERYLTYFVKQNLLTRRKGGKSFLYYKAELTALASRLKHKEIVLPTTKAIYKND